ncbi:MAG: DUF721 domain-containing protein [Bacteroidales bacterium]|nr:DUF721 domain-containing protein [Bacteroidales bacterium]
MQPDRTIDYFLQRAMRRLELGEVADEMRVERVYRQLAGDLISRLTTSVLFSKGTLTLRLRSAALRHEMFNRRDSLRHRINDQLGAEVVQKIVIH